MKLMNLAKSSLILTALFLTACADTTSINQQAASSYAQTVGEIKRQGAVDTTSTTAKRIHRVFNKMLPFARKENSTGVPFAWEITVVKSDELNAWAMPGGKMMFYTGLVNKLKLNDDEIAVVMGHEMAHALKEHGKSKVNVSIATGIAAELASVALASQGIDTGMNAELIGLTKDFALDKPFSRSKETEADEVGLMLMAKSGYNPTFAPGLWDKMQAATGKSSGLLATLASTHPSDEDRKKNLERLMPQALALYKK